MDHGSISVRRAFLHARGSRFAVCLFSPRLFPSSKAGRRRPISPSIPSSSSSLPSQSFIDSATPTGAESEIAICRISDEYEVCILRLGPFGQITTTYTTPQWTASRGNLKNLTTIVYVYRRLLCKHYNIRQFSQLCGLKEILCQTQKDQRTETRSPWYCNRRDAETAGCLVCS